MAKDDEKKESGEWKEFFWNPRTHELLGRTASSWGLILLFYLVFYTFLAGMFCLTMYVMLLTLDDYKPTWQDRLATPEMVLATLRSWVHDLIKNVCSVSCFRGKQLPNA
uniref:Sodium/potassium-transporting ATPase subunit beta-2 n=1 Tax=Cyprinus carpio carpio TaxID=630221 RepID=A0A9J7XEU1_CYPCA